MKNLSAAFAVLLVAGTLAVAQTRDLRQSTPSTDSTVNSAPSNNSVTNPQSSDDKGTAQKKNPKKKEPKKKKQGPTDLDRYRGTELYKLYQQGSQNPNVLKSANGPGGG